MLCSCKNAKNTIHTFIMLSMPHSMPLMPANPRQMATVHEWHPQGDGGNCSLSHSPLLSVRQPQHIKWQGHSLFPSFNPTSGLRLRSSLRPCSYVDIEIWTCNIYNYEHIFDRCKNIEYVLHRYFLCMMWYDAFMCMIVYNTYLFIGYIL